MTKKKPGAKVGRPKKAGAHRDALIQVAAGPELAAQVKEAASEAGLSASQWLRGAAEARLGAPAPYDHKPLRGEGGAYYGETHYRPGSQYLPGAWVARLAGWGRPRWEEAPTEEEAKAKLLGTLPEGSTIRWESNEAPGGAERGDR